MAEFVKIANVADLHDGQVIKIEVKDVEIALVRHGDKFFALDNTCVHQGGPLGEGELEDENVVCPWHGWKFNVKTGISPIIPQARVKTYEVKIEGKDVLVKI